MSDHSHDHHSTIQPWIVSFGISIFCCALFFAFMSSYVGAITKSLSDIDERLANIEARAMAEPVTPQVQVVPPAPIAAPATPIAPQVEPAPVAGTTGSNVDVPAVPSVQLPSAAPAPEATSPVLPTVPTTAAPINPAPTNKQ